MYNQRRKCQSNSANQTGSAKKKDNKVLTRCFDEFNDPDSSDEDNNEDEFEGGAMVYEQENQDEEENNEEMPLPTFTYTNKNSLLKSPRTLQNEYMEMAQNPKAYIKKEKV